MLYLIAYAGASIPNNQGAIPQLPPFPLLPLFSLPSPINPSLVLSSLSLHSPPAANQPSFRM